MNTLSLPSDSAGLSPVPVSRERRSRSVGSLLGQRSPPINTLKHRQMVGACSSGDHAKVIRLVEDGFSPNSAVQHEFEPTTPLLIATKMNRASVVQALIQKGADVNARGGPSGVSPVCLAAEKENIEIFKLLLDAGADVNALDGDADNTRCPLSIAVDHENTELLEACLARKDVNINIVCGGFRKETPLHLAIRKGSWEMFVALLEAGADPQAIARSETPLFFACEKDKIEMARHLITTYNVDVNGPGSPPIMAVVSEPMLKLLIESGADINAVDHTKNGRTALHHAVACRAVPIVKALIKAGADVNKTDFHAKTPLHEACEGGSVRDRKVKGKIAKLLLAAGADKEALTENHLTALQLACKHNHVEAARHLIYAGANLYACANGTLTPLEEAVMRHNTDMLEELIKAHIDLTGEMGKKALSQACAQHTLSPEIVHLLLEAGVDVNVRINGTTLLHKLVEAPKIKSEDSYETVLDEQQLEVLKLLLDTGLNPDFTDDKGCTALHIACSNGHLEVAEELLRRGASLQARDAEGLLPLHHACKSATDHVPLLHVLIDNNGALAQASEADQFKALEIACVNGKYDIAWELIRYGVDLVADANRPQGFVPPPKLRKGKPIYDQDHEEAHKREDAIKRSIRAKAQEFQERAANADIPVFFRALCNPSKYSDSLLLEVMGYLDEFVLCSLSATCALMHRASSDNTLWRQRYTRRFEWLPYDSEDLTNVLRFDWKDMFADMDLLAIKEAPSVMLLHREVYDALCAFLGMYGYGLKVKTRLFTFPVRWTNLACEQIIRQHFDTYEPASVHAILGGIHESAEQAFSGHTQKPSVDQMADQLEGILCGDHEKSRGQTRWYKDSRQVRTPRGKKEKREGFRERFLLLNPLTKKGLVIKFTQTWQG